MMTRQLAPNTMYIPYSLSNIPLPSKFNYQKMLTARMEQLLKNMRWKLYWFKKKKKTPQQIEVYGFKSTSYPPSMPEIKKFEEELLEMIPNIEMRPMMNPLQQRMKEDLNKMKTMEQVIVKADKTSNLYLIKPEEYKKLLANNITADYKKSNEDMVDKINIEAAKIARSLKLDGRIEGMAKKRAYLSMKDHKEDFPERISCRLINPCKTNIGKISKTILEKINLLVRKETQLQQWRSTGEVLDWYKKIDKRRKKWIKYDIEAYYPSVTAEVLAKAIQFARQYTEVTSQQENIILHCRKNIVVGNDDTVWVKKENEDFDNTMGSYDSAEVAELVGLFMLHKMEDILPKDSHGLYRDDGLCIVEGSGPMIERTKKKIVALFKGEGFKITTEANLIATSFLDVWLNLEDGSFKPHIKTNANTKYVSPQSSHPPSIIKNIPDSISKRLSSVSSSKEEFDKEVGHYQNALDQAGYKEKLEYKMEGDKRSNKRFRSRVVMWFNPPFASNVKTNIGKRFLQLVKKHFPPSSELHKIFNTKTLKLSYSCCPSMEALIASHNARVLKGKEKPAYGCNCREGEDSCPLDGRCQTPSLVYEAKVESSEGVRRYIGQTAITFKLRWNNHRQSFTTAYKKHSTSLSSHIWQLKKNNTDYDISWSTKSMAKPMERGGKSCNLCLTEKSMIASSKDDNLLNKRNEVMTRCLHRFPHLLNNWYTSLPLLPPPDPGGQHLGEPEHEEDQQHQLMQTPSPSPPPPPLTEETIGTLTRSMRRRLQ
jgi:hypothetical protein